jgi:hypothetical protein
MHAHAFIARRRALVAFTYVLAFLWGFYAALDQDHPIELLYGLTFGAVLTYLCIVDARLRGAPLVFSYHWLIFLTWPLSVPAYWIWTRRWKQMHRATLMIVIFIAMAALGSIFGMCLLHHV